MEWYKLKIEDILKQLNTSLNGLDGKEINNKLRTYGYNELPKNKKDSIITILFREVKDPIVLILIVTVIFSFMIGETIDAFAIIFIILIDLIMGTFQEWKALKNAEALSSMIKVNTRVIRNNKEELIDSKMLVPGDIVLLESGDKISADLRIIECSNLQVDESILTGESLNVLKNNIEINNNTALAERINMLYAGTSVITGRAKAIVVDTAINTEIGKIADKVSKTKEEKSPLTIRMNKFSKQISCLIIIVAIIIAMVMYVKGVDRNNIFLSVIALSVSAMPEGLPLALTMALTIASNRMAKKNVIVKKLNSVESLGSCTIIASDKTGTLTINEQTAKKILLPNNEEFDISGIGYNDVGIISPVNNSNISNAYEIAKLCAVNNEAHLEKEKKEWNYFGDSIDVAFLALSRKLKVDTKDINIISKIPYESENKYSAVFYEYNNKTYCTVKGSIEKVCDFCNTMGVENEKINMDLLNKQNEKLASDGYRVIAVANGEVIKENSYNEKNIKNLNFLGLTAFIDPIREEVKESIEQTKKSGIKVVMITGDHPLTAYKIAKELSLVENYDEVATSSDIEEYLNKGNEAFDNYIKNKKVFSRVTPIQKLEIVESYKRQGEFIAVTGDGVNDAPALRSANIGIAMGSGTDVAKETASMIITDDNFKSIVAGIKEGRTAYSNIRKIVYMLLSCGMAEVLFFLLSIIFNLPMPLVAIQLLWLNVVTDGLQDMALSFEKGEKEIMKDNPRNPSESLFDKNLIKEVFIASLTIGIIVFFVWYYLINNGMDISKARGYIMALMVFIQNIHVLNCRSEINSTFKISLKSNYFILAAIASSIILQFIVMEVPMLSKFLQTVSVPLIDLFKLLLLASIILIVMELYKLIKRKKSKKINLIG